MTDLIRVLIVDDLLETRENVRKLLEFEPDMEIVGQAGTGEEAIELAKRAQPDIILMDINMPGIDGISASQEITDLVPHAQIIIMSVQSDPDYMRRAMLAGTRYFLTKPFGGDELITAVRRVHAKRTVAPAPASPTSQLRQGDQQATRAPGGHVISVFSPSGGVGCSTVAINMAAGLAQSGYNTLLIDGSLQFGDVAVMLNLKPDSSIIDLMDSDKNVDSFLLDSALQIHQTSNLHVLLSPPRPEMADVLRENHIKELLAHLKTLYDFVIIDTTSKLDEITLAFLDNSERILTLTRQYLPSLKNASRFFDITQTLGYPPNNIWLAVNQASKKRGIDVQDISDILKRPIVAIIPNDEATALAAGDEGVPMVLGNKSRKQAISSSMQQLVEFAIRELEPEPEPSASESRGGLARLFGR